MSAAHIKSQKCITYQIVLNELLAKLKRWWGAVCQVLELCLELHTFQNFNIKPKKHRSLSGASDELQSWQQDISIGVGWLEDFAFPLLSNYFNNWVMHKIKRILGKRVRPLWTFVDRWVNARKTETGHIAKRTQWQGKGHYQHYWLWQRKRNMYGILNENKGE